MLGQIVFYTLNEEDRRAVGALSRITYPAIVTDVRDGSVVSLTVFTTVWHHPVWVRPDVAAGDPGEPGRWNAAPPEVAVAP